MAFIDIEELLVCPQTGLDMRAVNGGFQSTGDERIFFPFEDGILKAFVADKSESVDVATEIKAFYEENPFPDYEDLESVGSLISKSRARGFPEMLNRSISPNARVLEVGCGTGQLGNFLSIAGRRVLSVDMCLNSLRMAERFRRANDLRSVTFAQMSLFRLPLRREKFDVVICTGVLHHTGDALKGFQRLLPFVKCGGHVVIGLYNFFGRIKTKMRRVFFLRPFGYRFARMDPYIRINNLTGRKMRTWLEDQYRNPHETVHSIDEVLGWFNGNGIRFVRSLPSAIFGSEFQLEYRNSLFEEESRGSKTDRLLSQLKQMIFDKEGGLFIMIGKKA
jgi:SAM-dependent methyltransferase